MEGPEWSERRRPERRGGEKHVPPSQLGESDGDCSVYNGASPYAHLRVGGPGWEIAFDPQQTLNAQAIFGSYHANHCHFLMGDGRVIAFRPDVGGTILQRLILRDDGQAVPDFLE